MTERTYPRNVWVLPPSFKPKTVAITRGHSSRVGNSYDISASGKCYHVSEMFSSLEDAVADGWKRVELSQADLEKRAATLVKKREALIKAAG